MVPEGVVDPNSIAPQLAPLREEGNRPTLLPWVHASLERGVDRVECAVAEGICASSRKVRLISTEPVGEVVVMAHVAPAGAVQLISIPGWAIVVLPPKVPFCGSWANVGRTPKLLSLFLVLDGRSCGDVLPN